jgi:hypothetical protein
MSVYILSAVVLLLLLSVALLLMGLLWLSARYWRRDQEVFAALAAFVEQSHQNKVQRTVTLQQLINPYFTNNLAERDGAIAKLLSAEQHCYQQLMQIFADKNPKRFADIRGLIDALTQNFVQAIPQQDDPQRASQTKGLLFRVFAKYRSLFDLSADQNQELTLEIIEKYLAQEETRNVVGPH